MSCVKHQKRIRELEQALTAARKRATLNEASEQLKEDNAKLAEQNATIVEQLHSCKDCAERLAAAEDQLAKAKAFVVGLDPEQYVGYSESSGTWPVGDLAGDFDKALEGGEEDAG